MRGSQAATYGDYVAGIYDEQLSTSERETELTVAFLADLARDAGGPCLELGIGTGRIALPLSAAGVEVHGIDASPKMLEKLRTKAGAERITTTLGDFADLSSLQTTYPLIFVVFNTFFALTTSDAQIACFAGVARRLPPGGRFLIQAFVPDPARLANRQLVDVRSVDVGSVRVNVSRYDLAAQTISMAHLVIDETGTHLYPVPMRYAYPSELDLMAQLAGLRLSQRWSSWKRDPFDTQSAMHVSVYERPPEPDSDFVTSP